jgi:hypothetical protein
MALDWNPQWYRRRGRAKRTWRRTIQDKIRNTGDNGMRSRGSLEIAMLRKLFMDALCLIRRKRN